MKNKKTQNYLYYMSSWLVGTTVAYGMTEKLTIMTPLQGVLIGALFVVNGTAWEKHID